MARTFLFAQLIGAYLAQCSAASADFLLQRHASVPG
jgi:hypothetical protein